MTAKYDSLDLNGVFMLYVLGWGLHLRTVFFIVKRRGGLISHSMVSIWACEA